MALVPAPLVAIGVAGLLTAALGAPEFLPGVFTTRNPMGLLLPGLVTGLLAGFGQELGWTGFVVPRLRLRHSILATSLLVGSLWGAWHFPLFWRSDSFSTALPLTLLAVQLFSWLPAYRVLLAWLHDRTGSLLLAMLMHASSTATSMIVFGTLTDIQLVTSVVVSAAAWWLLVAIIGLTNPGLLSRRPRSGAEGVG